MTFDWFRRRYDKQEPEPAQPAETQPVQPEPEPSQESSTEANQDYLNWAKVAYENIRKRQQEDAQTAQVTELEDAQPAATTSEPSTTEDGTPELQDPATQELAAEEIAPFKEPDIGSIPISQESIAVEEAELDVTEPGTSESQAAEVPAVGAAAEPEPAAPLPFWAAAEAERQARLEQLRETAIAEPEPEVIPAPTPVSTATSVTEAPTIPDFALDEGFVWSAEILAAQGRRPDEISLEEITWLKRLRQGLDKTRRSLVNQLRAIVGQGPLNQDAVIEIEAALLQADVGVAATDAIIDALQTRLRNDVLPPRCGDHVLEGNPPGYAG